jgi:hypothetical protein
MTYITDLLQRLSNYFSMISPKSKTLGMGLCSMFWVPGKLCKYSVCVLLISMVNCTEYIQNHCTMSCQPLHPILDYKHLLLPVLRYPEVDMFINFIILKVKSFKFTTWYSSKYYSIISRIHNLLVYCHWHKCTIYARICVYMYTICFIAYASLYIWLDTGGMYTERRNLDRKCAINSRLKIIKKNISCNKIYLNRKRCIAKMDTCCPVGNVYQYRAFRLQYRIFKMENYLWGRQVGEFIPAHTTSRLVSKICFCAMLVRNWIRYLVIYFFRPCTAYLSLYLLINMQIWQFENLNRETNAFFLNSDII